jgi:hypothetical protein
MSLNKTLKKLLAEKEELVASITLCCKSVEFWEKRADIIFEKIDEADEEFGFEDDFDTEKKNTRLMQESARLVSRIAFENNQLDMLEVQILDLEEKIVKSLAQYAKKQKK